MGKIKTAVLEALELWPKLKATKEELERTRTALASNRQERAMLWEEIGKLQQALDHSERAQVLMTAERDRFYRQVGSLERELAAAVNQRDSLRQNLTEAVQVLDQLRLEKAEWREEIERLTELLILADPAAATEESKRHAG